MTGMSHDVTGCRLEQALGARQHTRNGPQISWECWVHMSVQSSMHPVFEQASSTMQRGCSVGSTDTPWIACSQSTASYVVAEKRVMLCGRIYVLLLWAGLPAL